LDSALAVHRLHFAFTITYHYLFPQLTMGLAPVIVILKVLAMRGKGDEHERAARLLGQIFAINFVFGVVTGIPMEFQFGTNWARFSRFAGGVIGQTLAMEGMFAFFLESTFIGLFLFGGRRLSPRAHLATAVAVLFGSWLSGYFIVATDAWMQHPVGFARGAGGDVQLTSFWALISNGWAVTQYLHTMGGAVVTGAFAAAALGAYYRLRGQHDGVARVLLRVGVVVALLASLWQLFPSGDLQGKMVAQHQPATLAAMEGVLRSPGGATPLVLLGQPDAEHGEIDNSVAVPGALSVLTHHRWNTPVRGLDSFPADQRPDNVGLLYYSYHVMVGLGTLFIALMVLAGVWLWRDRLASCRPLLWCLLLSVPLPYIANTAGWMTAEIGRQPWLVHGLLRTAVGTSHRVSAGNALFSMLGFMGLYSLLSVVFVLVLARIVESGPSAASHLASLPAPQPRAAA
jgi:cytochrome d ubiquinol oxidase subunit I